MNSPQPQGIALPPGLAQPARRALTAAGIYHLEDLTRFREVEVKKLHGIGSNALALLRLALAEKGFSFITVQHLTLPSGLQPCSDASEAPDPGRAIIQPKP